MKMLVTAILCLCSVLLMAACSGKQDVGNPEVNASDDVLGITVQDMTGLRHQRPVTGGVPLPMGAAPAGIQFGLHDSDGQAVPLQSEVIAQWEDGSARWVLLDFQSNPPPNEIEHYRLSWGEGEAVTPAVPAAVSAGATPNISSGDVSLVPVDDAILRISDRADIRLNLIDNTGQPCPGIVETIETETAGPLRSTLLLKGFFRSEDGARLFGFRMRASVYAGLSRLYLEPGIVVDAAEGLVQHIRALNLEIIPRNGMQAAAIGGEPEWRGKADKSVRLLQVDDQNYVFEGAAGEGGQAPGWSEFNDGDGAIAVAMRDFWQQWPKSLETDSEKYTVGLFPSFEAGAFEHMEPWYKHQYLFENNTYELRTGQARRWQIWLDLNGNGAELAQCADTPLVPAADPTQAIDTGVWGYVAPAGSKGMDAYDNWAENLFDNGYCNSIRVQRDYGAMNWGDWFGERKCNWGNHEYDTSKHILVQFARTGDPKYFHVGDNAARHISEVDVVHAVNADLKRYLTEDIKAKEGYPVRPGMLHQHSVGHVGGFDSVEKVRELFVELGNGFGPNPYLCLDPRNLGHIWTQGLVYQYFLTGDPWMKETVTTICDNIVQLVEDREFKFKGNSHCGRVNGWTMQAIAAGYELELNNRYKQAMSVLAEDALSEQDPNCGGWIYKLPAGHCNCTTNKHVGEAGFISSVRLNGLSRYYELTGDERIPEAIQRGVTHLNNDTWMEQYSGWRYTTCPANTRAGQTGVTMMALVNSIKLTRDEEHLRILRKAWDTKFTNLLKAPKPGPGFGKMYSQAMYGCPEAMNLFVNGLE
jgi:hypothetical protein